MPSASVEKRIRNSRTSWLARWRDPDGRQRKRSFTRRVDADRFLTKVKAEMLRGEYVDPSDPTTFQEYAESWRVSQVHRPSTQAHVETNLRRHVYPHFGQRRLNSIRPSEIQTWVTRIAGQLSPSTVQVLHGIVASIYKSAIKDRHVNASPCEGTKLPKKRPREVVPLATDVVQKLAETIPGRYYALVVLAAGTGMRQGECFGLTVDRVDFMRGTVRVDRQLVHLARAEPAFGPPKTIASHRTIPLPAVVVGALSEHVRLHPVTHPDGLLFTDDDGAALQRTRFSREIWRPTIVAVPDAPAGTGMHDLRHYYASLLIRHGESVKTVQSRLGHATAAETLDTYAHLWPDSDDRTRDAIDTVLGAAVPPVRPRRTSV